MGYKKGRGRGQIRKLVIRKWIGEKSREKALIWYMKNFFCDVVPQPF